MVDSGFLAFGRVCLLLWVQTLQCHIVPKAYSPPSLSARVTYLTAAAAAAGTAAAVGLGVGAAWQQQQQRTETMCSEAESEEERGECKTPNRRQRGIVLESGRPFLFLPLQQAARVD